MSVKLIRLVTGEEIVGKVCVLEYRTIISDALMLLPTQQGLQFVPFPMLAKDNKEISINNNNVVYVCEVKSEILAAYEEEITGIVRASAGTLDKKGKLIL